MIKNLGRYRVEAEAIVNSGPRIASKALGMVSPKTVLAEPGSGSGMSGTGMGGLNSPGGFGGFGLSGGAIISNYAGSVVEDFLNVKNEPLMRKIYRDIYAFDPVCGSAIDLMSTLPFSDFTLSDLPSRDMIKAYATSIENLHMKTLLPELSIDYNVLGAHVSVLNFDSDKKVFSSIMPQDLDLCDIQPTFIYGVDPLIDLRVPKEMTRALSQRDSRLDDLGIRLPDYLVQGAKSGIIKLQPENTLYIARKTYSTHPIGVSLLRRVLPFYLYEKALMRGSIESAYRRQRGILHLEVGLGDEWTPTNEEIASIVNMFIAADVDPTGAIVGTREGIVANEVRNGGDFFRVDEIGEYTAANKLRALGISESFLSSDSNYSTVENALSTFMEGLRSFREMITRKVFSNKIFPMIAITNGFLKENSKKTVMGMSQYELLCDGAQKMRLHEKDLTKYHMPKLNWHKQLKPEADDTYLQVLSTLQSVGVPIPLRMWAAAGGLSLPEIVNSLDEDIILRKKVAKYNNQIPPPPGQMGGDGSETASLRRVLGRDYSGVTMVDEDTGKTLSVKGRSRVNEKVNKVAAQALANLAKRDNLKIKKNHQDKKTSLFVDMKINRPLRQQQERIQALATSGD